MSTPRFTPHRKRSLAILSLAFLAALSSDSYGWWNKDWSARKKFTVDATAQGVEISEPIGTATVLIRLHDGNFQFGVGKDDGSDLRFVSADDKTVLPHQIEKFDGLMHEAFVWVQVPEIKPGQATPFFLYYGNAEGGGETADFKKTYDPETALTYHFAEKGSAPSDSSRNGNSAENAGTASEGSMIGTGLRLLGQGPITIPPSESLNFFAGDPFTLSAWVKPGAPKPNAALYSRSEGGNGIVIGLDQGKPYVEITAGGTPQRASATEAIPSDAWKHLAVTSADGKTTLYVDGEAVGSVGAGLPELKGVATLGGTSAAFVGEVDQLEISKAARGAGFLKLAAVSQAGTDKAGKLLVAGEAESSEGGGGHNEALEHVMLFGDIAKNMMFDGWLVVFACAIMALVSWFVAIRKFLYLNKSAKGDEAFLKQWKEVATDLTALDHGDKDNVRSLGGKVDARTQRKLATSPIYHIYHVGSEEINHRQRSTKGGFQGLSARSIQAIRASLDAGMQRELHRLHGGLVFLTISIAGGPYVGLLGTVMGVMITFAVIAKTGEVEVNSIAPGIASALLATVAGLLVAIPALFIYSYLNSRIKNSASAMQMFIDEFVAKMAEFYPTPSDLPGGRTSFAEALPTNAEGAVTGSPR